MQTIVRRLANDSANAWSDDDYLNAINEAIVYVSKARIAKLDPSFISAISINNGDVVPNYFIDFAGTYPVQIVDGRFSVAAAVAANFYKMPAALLTLSDTINVRTDDVLQAIKLHALTVLKETRGTFDMTNEKARRDAVIST